MVNILKTLLLFLSLMVFGVCSTSAAGWGTGARGDASVITESKVPAAVSGKVTVKELGQSGIRVMAYPVSATAFDGKEAAVSGVTDSTGEYSMVLPPGQYYFIAEGGKYFTYYGRNPVSVPPAGIAEMNLAMVEKNPTLPEIKDKDETGFDCLITYNGEPASGVIVSVYTDLNQQLKGMGLGMTAPSNQAGMVSSPVQAGTYYIVARKRNSGRVIGPLQAGDFFGYYAGNPLVIKEGQKSAIAISLVEVPKKVSALSETMFGQTSISGRVVDEKGQPVAGVRVLLYDNVTMLNRPLYVSQQTGADGTYVISFPEGGTYFLAARDKIGGAPGPGELYGRFLGSADGSLMILKGKNLKDIDLTVEKMW